jgi:hypothetical protein
MSNVSRADRRNDRAILRADSPAPSRSRSHCDLRRRPTGVWAASSAIIRASPRRPDLRRRLSTVQLYMEFSQFIRHRSVLPGCRSLRRSRVDVAHGRAFAGFRAGGLSWPPTRYSPFVLGDPPFLIDHDTGLMEIQGGAAASRGCGAMW